MGGDLTAVTAEFRAFWTEPRTCLLATVTPDGTPHVVAVNATLDLATATAEVLARRTSKKIRNVLAAGPSGARVAVTAIDGRRWSTLQGTGRVRGEPAEVAAAERRYAVRHRTPTPHPERVVLEIAVDHVLGSVR